MTQMLQLRNMKFKTTMIVYWVCSWKTDNMQQGMEILGDAKRHKIL